MTGGSRVKAEIIEPLVAWFPNQRFSKGRCQIYADVLGQFPIKVLRQAMQQLKFTWTLQSPPQPATLLEACKKVEEDNQQGQAGCYNFGVLANTQCCSCGRHHGVGEWSPKERARRAAWRRHKGYGYHGYWQSYLESYERHHGVQEPDTTLGFKYGGR